MGYYYYYYYYDFLLYPGKSVSLFSKIDIIYLCNFNIVFIFLADGLFILLLSRIGKIRLFHTKFLIRRNFKICIYMSLHNSPRNMFQTIASYISIQETSMTFPFWIIINILIIFLNYIVIRKVTIIIRGKYTGVWRKRRKTVTWCFMFKEVLMWLI